jgi:glycosyltransferase involved in cell wall biosynthesis
MTLPFKLLGLPGRPVGHPCTDYRLTWPLRELDGQIEYDITVQTDLEAISKYDLMVFQRQEMPLVEQITRAAQSMPAMQSSWVAQGMAWDVARLEAGHHVGKKVIFDIDDDAINIPPTNVNYLQWGRDRRQIVQMLASMKAQGMKGDIMDKPPKLVAEEARLHLRQLLANIRAVDAVTVTTPWLKKVYSQYNRNIYVLPNWAVPQEWEGVEYKEHEGVHIGWAGGPTHYADIKVFVRPVKQILKEHPHVKLVIAGFPVARQMFFDDVDEDRIITYPFMEEWRHNLATFDIILAPADDNKFNRGKSAIRVYEGLCATKGQAAVVGSETTYGHTIRALGCGFVCKSFADWLAALERLIENKGLRRTLGQRGYDRMLAGHTYQGHAHEWLRTYEEILQ